MSRQTDALSRLERLARLKSDLEMRRFSAFRLHVEAARARITALEQEVQSLYDLPDDFSVAGARLTNALAQGHSRALLRAEGELAQMLPGFDAARVRAQREFGRAEVLGSLRQQSREADRAAREKKLSISW